MGKRTLEEIEQEIAETKAALQDVHGSETEVYARIVGYYRAVKHWNKGKRDEFDLRKMFTLEDSVSEVSSKPAEAFVPVQHQAEAAEKDEVLSESEAADRIMSDSTVTWELYTRKTCPNCPPVKDFMKHIDLPGRNIDVDTKEGLAEAARKGIFASPTVIFYNKEGVETARCHNVEELQAVFNKVEVLA